MSPIQAHFAAMRQCTRWRSCRLLVVRMGFGFTSAPGANERETCLFQPRP